MTNVVKKTLMSKYWQDKSYVITSPWALTSAHENGDAPVTAEL